MKDRILNRFITPVFSWRKIGVLLGLVVIPFSGLAGEKVDVYATSFFISFNVGHVKATKSGNLHIKGMTSVNRLESTDQRLQGRLTWTGDFNGDIELNGVGSGSGLLELGTWDETHTVFTASNDESAFFTSWHGTGNLVNDYEVKINGHGVAGAVKGVQLQLTAKGNLMVAEYTGRLLDPHAKSGPQRVAAPIQTKTPTVARRPVAAAKRVSQ